MSLEEGLMSRKQPIPLSVRDILHACALAIFRPDSFEVYAKRHNDSVNRQPNAEEARRVDPIRRGYCEAAVWMTVSVVAGALGGAMLKAAIGVMPFAVAVTAIVGTGIILWASLAYQGWTVQTYSDATLEERVNRWLFRFLYSLGTFLIAVAATWQIT
jgi:hypothetical protein